jgi:hypothetical protein
VLAELDEAEKAGDVSSADAGSIRRRLDPAHTIDESVKKSMQATSSPAPAKSGPGSASSRTRCR